MSAIPIGVPGLIYDSKVDQVLPLLLVSLEDVSKIAAANLSPRLDWKDPEVERSPLLVGWTECQMLLRVVTHRIGRDIPADHA